MSRVELNVFVRTCVITDVSENTHKAGIDTLCAKQFCTFLSSASAN